MLVQVREALADQIAEAGQFPEVLTHSLTHSLTSTSLTHSLPPSPTHYLTPLLTTSLPHYLTHSLTSSLPDDITPYRMTSFTHSQSH